MFDAGAIERFAASSGVSVRWPRDYVLEPHRWDRRELLDARTRDFDVRTNPCVDFGRYLERIPRCVLGPRTTAELEETLAFLSSARTRYKIRGTGHSSGGQTLSDEVVVALDGLSFVEDHGGSVTAGGGTLWIDVLERLFPTRRPVVLTDNLRATVGGTLSVGGFGDTSHRYGLQIDSVIGLEIVTPDGALHHVDRSSELFRLSLAGRGLLGAIASATLEVLERPAILRAKLATFPNLAAFVDAAPALERLEWIRARWFESTLEAIIGTFGDPFDLDVPAGELSSTWEAIDLAEISSRDPIASWGTATPAVEVVLPLPNGVDTAEAMRAHLERAGVAQFLGNGVSVAVVPASPLPLAPTRSGPSLLVAFRPKMPPSTARAHLDSLKAIGSMALDAGGRLYMMSVEPDVFDLRLQWGPALDRVTALARQLDPDGACNFGLLER